MIGGDQNDSRKASILPKRTKNPQQSTHTFVGMGGLRRHQLKYRNAAVLSNRPIKKEKEKKKKKSKPKESINLGHIPDFYEEWEVSFAKRECKETTFCSGSQPFSVCVCVIVVSFLSGSCQDIDRKAGNGVGSSLRYNSTAPIQGGHEGGYLGGSDYFAHEWVASR